jgi:hypothetical protein
VRNFEFISGVFNVIEIMHKHTTRDWNNRRKRRPHKFCHIKQKWVKSLNFSFHNFFIHSSYTVFLLCRGFSFSFGSIHNR